MEEGLVKSKHTHESNISIEEWKTYFENLSKYDDLHDINIILDNDDDVQIDIDEVEEIVFNSPITQEETLKKIC